MVNPWFKFYGGEWLVDPKRDAFDGNEQNSWTTVMALASQSDGGWILYTTEERLLEKAGIRTEERSRYTGLLLKLFKFEMLEFRNGDVTQGFRPKNWEKRQYSEGYSRVRKFREKNINENETLKITIEENREEEKRIDKNTDTIAKKFAKPSLEEIKTYCTQRSNGVNPDKFFNYYESNGWKVGKNSMKDWQAAIRTWEKNELATTIRQPKVYGEN